MADLQLDPTVNLQPKPAPQRRWGKSNERQQAVAIQRVLAETIINPATPEQSRASCAAAWARVQEAKRIIDGRPLPGQLRPDLAQASSTKRLGPPARVAQRVVVLPKPAGPAEPKAVVVPQDQSMLKPTEPGSATGA